MRLDARSLPEGETLRTDLCIVGAGAAGIALAHELRGADVDVCLMESGGVELETETQQLYRGENVGRPYFPLEASRLRVLGGTTAHWAGLCRPLDPIDFEKRAWVPYSGWPIDRKSLDPYYERARSVLELGPEPADLGARRPADAADVIPFDPERLQTAIMSFSPPTRMGPRYRRRLERAKNIRLVLHANAVDIEREPHARRIRRVRFATLEGRSFAVEARRYVLATGAIENARLLLASDGVERDGLGNERGLVGRFFMEHPHVDTAATWLIADGSIHRDLYEWPIGGRAQRDQILGVLTPSDAVQRREHMLGFSAELQLSSPWRQTEAWRSARLLAQSMRAWSLPDDLSEHVRRVFSDLGSVYEGTWEELSGEPGDGASYVLKVRAEQSPHPDSRVTLGRDRDALGMRRVELDWRLDELDLASLRRGLELVAAEVGRAGFGRVQVPEGETAASWWASLRGGWHHMGTTRMSADPSAGVVDADGRLHGLENLYVAGSSVFPTSGWANPTLTIAALAIRLADHLRERLAAGRA